MRDKHPFDNLLETSTSYTTEVGKVRPAGQIQPMSSANLAHCSSSVLTLNLAHVLPPNARKHERLRLFSCRAEFSHTLIVYADWLSYTRWWLATCLRLCPRPAGKRHPQTQLKLYYEMWQTHTKHWKFSENDSAEKHKKTRKHVNTNILAN